MSEFDSIASDIWGEIESVFGDQGVWRASGKPAKVLTVVVDSDYRQIFGRAGEAIVSISLQKSELPAPLSSYDTLEIQSGRWAGRYDNPRAITDDGYTLEVEMRVVN